MSTINYEGSKPIYGLWVLDNGEKVFTFTSVVALSLALASDHAQQADSPRRTPTLQWMGADGYCDGTALLAEPAKPGNLPNDIDASPLAQAAMAKHLVGDSQDWYELTNQANKLRIDHRIELARKIRAFHILHLQPLAGSQPTLP